LTATAGTTLRLKGDHCNVSLAKLRAGQVIEIKLPVGPFHRINATKGSLTQNKVFQVSSGSRPKKIHISMGSSGCNIATIMKDIQRGRSVSSSKLSCLTKINYGQPKHLDAHLSAAGYYCKKKRYPQGKMLLKKLTRYPKYKFRPYSAMKLGVYLGRCKDYRNALQMLRKVTRMTMRFSSRDRYRNTKALYRALAQLYEQSFYRTKNALDLTRAVKAQQRLVDIVRSSDRREKSRARKELKRYKKLAKEKGALETE